MTGWNPLYRPKYDRAAFASYNLGIRRAIAAYDLKPKRYPIALHLPCLPERFSESGKPLCRFPNCSRGLRRFASLCEEHRRALRR